MTTVSGVTKHWLTAQEGFTTTTSGSVSSGAATVGLNSVSGYANGEVVVFVIDPTDTNKKQAFTGTIDTSGVQVTGVVWTEGTNQTHAAGATVVDYETATGWAMLAKGLKVSHDDDGTLKAGAVDVAAVLATDVVETAKIKDLNVTTAKIADSNVTTAKIADDAVTPAKWTNPYCFRAYPSGATTVADASDTKITFGTEVYDYNNNFASSTYTAPVDGVYHFGGHAEFSTSITTGVTAYLALYVNGSVNSQGERLSGSAYVTTAVITISADTLLTAGQTVELYAYQDSAGTEALTTGANSTYFYGHLVHAT